MVFTDAPAAGSHTYQIVSAARRAPATAPSSREPRTRPMTVEDIGPRMASSFRFLACDWMTGSVMAELPLVLGNFERRLNGTGMFTCELPAGDPDVQTLDPFTSTQPGRTHLFADLDGVLVARG